MIQVRSWGQEFCSEDTALTKESQLTSSPTLDHGDRTLLYMTTPLCTEESARELMHCEIMGTGACSQDTALTKADEYTHESY